MRYCAYCGAELQDDAAICMKCGCKVENRNNVSGNTSDTMNTIIKVFLIIGCVTQGWMLLPLAWCIPITVSIFNSLRDRRPIGTGMKICTLLFVNVVAGICLLCMNDE